MVLAIAITESNCRYDVRHPDKDTCGIGGIKAKFWQHIEEPNSLLAIESIVDILRDKYDNNIYAIIKYYKGGSTNLKSTDKCFKLYKDIKEAMDD